MNIQCVRVSRTRRGWGVSELGLDWILAEFDQREDALDYARAVAIASGTAILEREDEFGRLEMRLLFSIDPAGVIRMNRLEDQPSNRKSISERAVTP